MIENIWGWTDLITKFPGDCLICNIEMPVGSKAKWKSRIGIIHSDCLNKLKELEKLKDQALTKYHLNQIDDAEKSYKKIQQLEKELNYVRSIEEFLPQNPEEIVKILNNALDNNKELKKYANKSKTAFKRNFKPIFYDIAKSVTNKFAPPTSINSELDEEEKKQLEEELEKGLHKICDAFAETKYEKWRLRGQFLFDGRKPYHERAQYNEIVNSASQKLDIADKYFNKDSLHLLMLVLDLENTDVKEIRILTSLINMQNQISPKFKNLFEKFKTELKEDWDIDCQMKVMSSEELTDKIHDRFYLSSRPEISFTVGSTSYLFERTNTISRLHDVEGGKLPDFDAWWNDKDALDIIEDWDQISKQVNSSLQSKTKNKNYVCSNPSCKTPIRFVPPHVIEKGLPILCPECRQK